MILKTLRLTNFKNIRDAHLDFSPKMNCLLGNNGMGKSNLLDAIYYLSFCKSFTGVADAMLINRDEDFAIIQGHYQRGETDEDLMVGMQRGRRRSFKRGGKEYQRLSEHIGRFPLVIVSPSDMGLIDGAGEERRRLMDMVISQTDARYLDVLMRYNRALEQRNRLLRDGATDANLYAALELTMTMAADYICAVRRDWVKRLSEIFDRYYRAISGDSEEATIAYKSHLTDADTHLDALLDERRGRDMILKYTSAGPHRDDLEMMLSGMPARRTASQGQAKTFTIALRLAQYEFLAQSMGVKPILLLDDIFDKLDSRRVAAIMDVASSDTFGQTFITDTNRKHLDEILTHAGGQYALWNTEDGTFTPIIPTV